MGPRAIREYLRGKDASHIKSVKNAPGIARLSDNVLWERHSRNVKRGAANMGFGDRLRAAGTNGIDAAKSVGKRAIGDASKATLWAALTELPVSAAEGFIRVAKGKKSKEEAAKDAASNTVRAGVAGGVVAGLHRHRRIRCRQGTCRSLPDSCSPRGSCIWNFGLPKNGRSAEG